MRFGIDTFITDQSTQPGTLARAIEERGLDTLLVTEHSHIPVRRESPWAGGPELPEHYLRTYDPFVALAAAAAATTDLLLGTGIALVAQRDVIHLAKQVATLDQISHGRVLFGVGAGWNKEEARNHGTPPEHRGAILNEKLAALKQIWTQDQAQFHGRYVDFDPIYCWPKPVQRPHPPIYVGGESKRALERLVRLGDGWFPRAKTPPAQIAESREWLADQGRQVAVTVCGAAPDRSQVESFANLEVERITFTLTPSPEPEAMRMLDTIAEVTADFT